jgi:hypothetical protein
MTQQTERDALIASLRLLARKIVAGYYVWPIEAAIQAMDAQAQRIVKLEALRENDKRKTQVMVEDFIAETCPEAFLQQEIKTLRAELDALKETRAKPIVIFGGEKAREQMLHAQVAPAKPAQPLTNADILGLFAELPLYDVDMIYFARAIEAHIKGQA